MRPKTTYEKMLNDKLIAKGNTSIGRGRIYVSC